MSTKTKSKPRVMWATVSTRYPDARGNLYKSKRVCDAMWGQASTIRVAVIPLDDIEALVERALAAYWPLAHTQSDGIRAALTSAGIPCKQRRARK